MSTSVREVPALKLAVTSRGWTFDVPTVLRSGIQGGVFIPLSHRRTADDLLIQQRLRMTQSLPAFRIPNPTWLVFGGTVGGAVLLGGADMLHFVNTSTVYGPPTPVYGAPTIQAPAPGQWLSWNIRWDRQTLTGWYSSGPNTLATASLQTQHWGGYPLIEGIVIAAAESDCMIAELRLWEGRNLVRDGVGDLLDTRLDGREPGLIGYWKFDEGTGNEIRDSSRFGRHGKLNGGQWIAATQSGLSLDCTVEDVVRLRKAVRDLRNLSESAQKEIEALAQKKGPLEAHINELKARKEQIAAELGANLEAIDGQIEKAKSDHVRWREDMDKLSAVSLEHFSEEVAREIHGAVERIDQSKSPYRLERVDLQVKVLPVLADDKPGAEDYRVVFPDADTQIDPQQLTTLRFGFEVRPQSTEPGPIKVPDVRGYTELAAQRKLREAGLRMVAMERATDDPDKIGRVVAQIVEEEVDNERVVKQITSGDIIVRPNSVVTVFLGSASYGGARGMSAGANEPRS